MQQVNTSQLILWRCIFRRRTTVPCVDRNSDENLKSYSTLAEMAEKAIDRMKGHKVALYQIESGKVGRSCK
jgi:hypothetical protein